MRVLKGPLPVVLWYGLPLVLLVFYSSPPYVDNHKREQDKTTLTLSESQTKPLRDVPPEEKGENNMLSFIGAMVIFTTGVLFSRYIMYATFRLKKVLDLSSAKREQAIRDLVEAEISQRKNQEKEEIISQLSKALSNITQKSKAGQK